MTKKLKKNNEGSRPYEGYDADERIKYLKEKLDRYEKVVFKIIRPMMDAGVPDEIIQTILDGKSIVSVFYDKNKIGRSVQNVDMRFTTKDVKGEKQ